MNVELRDPSDRGPVWSPVPTKDERVAELHRTGQLASRDRLRDAIRTAVECFCWCVAGLYLMGLGFHVSDAALGRVLFYAGLVAGNSGIIASLYFSFLRARDRGDLH